MLERAGVPFTVMVSGVDEDVVKAEHRALKTNGENLAIALAEAKARQVSAQIEASGAPHRSLVIGADQILECNGEQFDKPTSRRQAAKQLKALRGRRHRLLSACVVIVAGEPKWQSVDTATLAMRPFSDAFVEHYLDVLGDRALSSVGAYQIEGLGAQLFDHVEGDHFTILGMPLLPLLAFLRDRKALMT